VIGSQSSRFGTGFDPPGKTPGIMSAILRTYQTSTSGERQYSLVRERIHTIKRTLYLTPAMQDHLTQLAQKRGRDCNENVLVREAIRCYLDNQTEVLGSRRHFQKSFQERIDLLEENLRHATTRDTQLLQFYLLILIHLVAFSLAHLISLVTRQAITPQQLIEKAIIQARKEQGTLVAQVDSVRQMSLPE
jgi:hypothetical protein